MHRLSEPIRPGAHDYRLFGLHIRSDLPLPELRPDAGNGDPDVRIRLLGEGGRGAGSELTIDDVARFYVEDGASIAVVPQPDAPERNVRLFLLGSAMGMLLHQRGLMPLHANAVEIGGKAVAFMGPSGIGKSTLAAWFHDRGHRIIADDVCVVRFDAAGMPWAEPGLPRLRLWKDALEVSGRDHSALERSYAGADDYEKFDLPLDDRTAERAVPLAACYMLANGEQPAILRLEGVEAADALFANTYRGQFVTAQMMQPYWENSLHFVRRTPLFLARRQWGREAFDGQCESLLRHAEEAVTNAGAASSGG